MIPRFLSMLILAFLLGCGRQAGPALVEDAGKSGEMAIMVVMADQPAPGALVQLIGANHEPLGEQKTDDAGVATFKNIPTAAGYQAIATLEGVTGKVTGLQVVGARTLAKIVLTPAGAPVGLLVGTVKSASSDQPLPGVAIEAADKRATTDTDGHFKIENMAAGPVTVMAQLSGYNTANTAIVVKAGASNAVVIVVQAAASGPKASHTVIASPTQVIELDAWRNQVGVFKVTAAWSAVFLPGGNVLVADGGANRVTEFSGSSTKGKFYTDRSSWQLGFGGLKDPHGASRTPAGTTLVADTGRHRIVELDRSNKRVWEYKASLVGPRWAERLKNGNTLVVDSGNNRIVEINSAGKAVWGLGDGSAETLNFPTHAQRLLNGNTLVCDAGNGRVMEVTPNHQVAWIVPGRGNEVVRLANPNSARRTASGTTLIAETDANRVIEVEPNGTLIWKVATPQPVFADRF